LSFLPQLEQGKSSENETTELRVLRNGKVTTGNFTSKILVGSITIGML
jgi:hypothetical protein